MLLSVKFYDDGEIPFEADVDLSKSQLRRLCLQIHAVMSLINLEREKNCAFLKFMQQEIKDMESNILNGGDQVKFMSQSIARRKQFREKNNFEILAQRVADVYRAKPSAKTIRGWYNEFIRYEKFKENLQGAHDREFFLEAYDYKRRFVIFMKYEKVLSVASATAALQNLILMDPPKTTEGQAAMLSLMPLSKRTVHRYFKRKFYVYV